MTDDSRMEFHKRDVAQAASARQLWAQLGVTNHTDASIKVANLLAQRELIERLEARITELKEAPKIECSHPYCRANEKS